MPPSKEDKVNVVGSDIFPQGSYAMLIDGAPLDACLLLGSEAVMRVLFQSGCDIQENGDGDLIVTRKYALEHLHRGRLFLDVPENLLTVIEPEAAKGQVLLHAEETRALVDALGLRPA